MTAHSLLLASLEVGVNYAVMHNDSPHSPLRPMRAEVVVGESGAHLLRVFNPDAGLANVEGWATYSAYRAGRFKLLGRWDERADGDLEMTWQGLAKHAYGEVLRQRDLVQRLAKLGIVREPEPYVLGQDAPNAIDRSVLLNYDELDLLLRTAGV